MLNIHYGKEGQAYSDFEVEGYVNEEVVGLDYSRTDDHIFSSTENLVLRIRVAIYKGQLNHEHVVLHHPEGSVRFDSKARPVEGELPDSVFDRSLDVLLGLKRG